MTDRTRPNRFHAGRRSPRPLEGDVLIIGSCVTDGGRIPVLPRSRPVTLEEAADIAQTAPPSTVVLLDPLVSRSAPESEFRIFTVASASRLVAVLAVLPFEPRYAKVMREMVDAGVTEIADAAFESTAATILPRLQAARSQPLKRAVEPLLSRFISPRALTLIRAAIEVTVEGGTAEELAERLEMRPRTVTEWCSREALPPPRRLLAWMRIFLIVALLAEKHRTIINVARCTGYTDHSLRRVVRAFLGSAVPLRAHTLQSAADAFNAELRLLRERARTSRPGAHAA